MQAVWTRNNKAKATAADRCCERRCSEKPEVVCSFIDQYGWRCSSPACIGHAYEIGDGILCRTHASLCFAVGGDTPPLEGELCDQWDQTPTLLRWMTRGLDQGVRSALEHEGSGIIHEQGVCAKDPRTLAWWARWARTDADLLVALNFAGAADPTIVVSHDGEILKQFNVPASLHSPVMRYGEFDPDSDIKGIIVARVTGALAVVNIATTIVELTGKLDLTKELASTMKKPTVETHAVQLPLEVAGAA